MAPVEFTSPLGSGPVPRRNGNGTLRTLKPSGKADVAEPIAIIGLACRLPGNATSGAKFWDLLVNGRSSQCNFPPSRFNVDGFYQDESKGDTAGGLNMRGGYFLQEDIRNFENEFFGINNVEATYMDPQQRKLLEVVFECFESAGVTMESLVGSNTGCYVGSFTTDFQTMQFRDPENLHQYSMSGMGATILSNRISHAFNLNGPSVTLDSACSASMYCLDTACNALSMGDCDSAIVAAANLIQSFEQQTALVKVGVLSKTGACHTFDSSADGYGRADAVGALYLKRLSDAIRDGDPVRSIIRGTAVNSNGKTQGIALPSTEHQERVIRKAYAKAGLDTNETTYVECHGTGTPVGDPIEVDALHQAFKGSNAPLRIGSVKTNIGHGGAASAISGLIKVTLALEHKFIPPSVGVTEIHPKIKTRELNIDIVTEGQPWSLVGSATTGNSKPGLLRAGVSSFGYGGANGHAILESAEYHLPPKYAKASQEVDNGRAKYILPFSGGTTEALKARVDDLGTKYNLEAVSIEDLAYTLGCRRSNLEKRGYLMVSRESPSDAFRDAFKSENLRIASNEKSYSSSPATPYAFIFTGQGAQWPQMCMELFQEFAVFRDAIAEMDATLDSLPQPPSWRLKATLLEPKATSNVMDPAYSQACCIAIQVALTLLLRSWGITPSAVVGHSSGEVAASFAAGFLSLAEAIANAYYRGFVMTQESFEACGRSHFRRTEGGMIAAGISEETANLMIDSLSLVGQIQVACVNSPSSVTISGDNPAIESILEHLQEKKLFARKLQTRGMAYHSHHMAPYAADYYRYLESFKNRSCVKESTKLNLGPVWVSSLTGDVADRSSFDNSYWKNNVEGVVQFSNAVSRLYELVPHSTMIELGPHSTLELPLKQIRAGLGIGEDNMPYSAAIIRYKDAVESVLHMAGELFLRGHSISFEKVNGLNAVGRAASGTVCNYRVLHDLPAYQWTYSDSPLWYEPRASSELRFRKHPRHELLGSLVPGGNGLERTWRNIINLESSAWLRDHKLGESIVFPAACYLAMAIEALCQTVGLERKLNSIVHMENVNVLSPLVIPDGQSSNIELFTTLRPTPISFALNSSEWWDFSIVSFRNGVSTTHATGITRIENQSEKKPVTAKCIVSEELLEPSAPKVWYEKLKSGGLDFGPDFQPVTEFAVSRLRKLKKCRAAVAMRTEFEHKNEKYFVHPVIIDVMMQASIISTSAGNVKDLSVHIPTRIGSAIFVFDCDTKDQVKGWSIHTMAATAGFGSALCGAELVGRDKLVKIRFENLRLASYEGGQIDGADGERHPMLRVEWKPDPSPGLMTRESLSSYLEIAAGESLNFGREFQNLSACLSMLGHKNPYLRVLELGDAEYKITGVALDGDYDEQSDGELSASKFDLKTGKFENSRVLANGQQFDLIILSYCGRNQIPKGLKSYLAAGGSMLVLSAPREMQGFLKENGFAAATVTNGQSSLSLIHRPEDGVASEDFGKRPVFVLEYTVTPFGRKLAAEIFRITGIEPQQVTFDVLAQQPIPTGSVVVSLLETQDARSALVAVSDSEFNRIKMLVEQASCLFWVSTGGLLSGQQPDRSIAFGLSRALMMEQPSLKFIVYDIDNLATSMECSAKNIVSVLGQISSSEDTEYIEKNGIIHISRFVPDETVNRAFRLTQGAAMVSMSLDSFQTPQRATADAPTAGARLSIKVPGQFDGLFFKETPLPTLESHQVQVSVRSVGLNAKDFYALGGRVDTKQASCVLEFCGVVEKVGSSSVGSLAVGDRVYVMAPTYFCTSEVVPHWACYKLQDEEEFGAMSVVPLAYATAIYALCNKACLQKGESVLIHSGAGGVGIAAIQLAQKMGAGEIFTTVSTADKRAFLIKNLGIKPENIFNSRDTSFAGDLMDATDGEGVDVVLNSLAGDLLHASWKCCGSFGRFVEISKRDLMEGGRLEMAQFLKNSTYTAFDLSNLYYSSNPAHRETWSSLIAKAFELHRTANFIGLPLETFDVENLPDALRKFGSRNRIGKISISLERPDSVLNVMPSRYRMKFSADKTYLMAPARRIIQELTALGARCKVVKGDVSLLGDVEKMVGATKEWGPIGGVVQAAMGLNHTIFSNMSNKDWCSGIDPKVKGTWNIHHALKGRDSQLDFFLLTSSVTGSLGAAAESSYTAANCFLDFFARHRRSIGLPATAVGLGMISEVGFLHENPDIENLLLHAGSYDTGAAAHVLTGLEPLSMKPGPKGTNSALRDPRASLLARAIHEKEESPSAQRGDLPAELLKAAESGTPLNNAFADCIANRFGDLVLIPAGKVNIQKPLDKYDIDTKGLGAPIFYSLRLQHLHAIQQLRHSLTEREVQDHPSVIADRDLFFSSVPGQSGGNLARWTKRAKKAINLAWYRVRCIEQREFEGRSWAEEAEVDDFTDDIKPDAAYIDAHDTVQLDLGALEDAELRVRMLKWRRM
ncbi:hypothetical protein Dda_4395 [Drechslerella dactyloides]|uniref:Carrier domain-containing protein n=1 Tax=Drechslerella dactyloides TaxID=74499 RepID=A0AAD6J171_DREDA|nr:hypothetical protein Dda_4395 [Drechslerella dactyloides]